MKKTLISLSIIVFCFSLKAQEIQNFEPKNNTYGLRNLKKNPKKIYIANFNVNIQIYKDAQDRKTGSKDYRKGKVVGDAKAVAAVGLGNLDKDMIQNKVNQLYNEYISELKNNGFEIISAKIAGQIDSYKDWTKADGPFLKESKIPGVIQIIPANYSYYYKEQSKLKSKLIKKLRVNANISSAISKELENALVSDVELYFLFTEDGAKDWLKGNAAKVKINVNYRLINSTTITNIKKSKSLFSIGSKTFDQVNTRVDFTQGKNKIGGSALSTYLGSLKKDLEINGVIKKEKIVAYQRQDSDRITSFKNFAIAEDRISKTANIIEVDSNKFSEGFYLAGKEFIFYHLKELLENY
tara:strand:- start:100 stop:1158 length:1059 start_codon:yes stop_codon:yes gene_type:complete